jgi:hypothetical protein
VIRDATAPWFVPNIWIVFVIFDMGGDLDHVVGAASFLSLCGTF